MRELASSAGSSVWGEEQGVLLALALRLVLDRTLVLGCRRASQLYIRLALLSRGRQQASGNQKANRNGDQNGQLRKKKAR